MVITSKENEKIKEIKKLKDKKYRVDRFIIEGEKILKEAIEEGANIEQIVLSENINVNLDISSFNNIVVSESVFKELTDVVNPQGVLAVIKKETKPIINYNEDLIVVLDGIQDPGNLGTIIRTLDSANLKQIIVSKDTVDAYSPKVIRSTMGSIFRVNVIEKENLVDVIKELNENGYETLATSLNASENIYNIDFKKKAIIIGNEANGVTDEVMSMANKCVKIPMTGKTESLNASIATSIIVYEYIRQNL